jgi:O-antigen/teichoic acid export membrane protein
VAVARFLGASALGTYAVLFSTLLLVVALQTSWVGDSLTVLDRRVPSVRSGLECWQLIFTLGGAVIGAAFAAGATKLGASGVFAFSVLVAAWQLEEYGRRLFMARLEFSRLAANDGTYLVAVLLPLMALRVWGNVTLTGVLWSMAFAAAVAFLAGVLVLPPDERLHLAVADRSQLASVASFGFWRSAQAGMGAASGLTVRVLVAGLGSAAVLGNIEAARLLVAPLFVLLAASSNLLLPLFVELRGSDGSDTAAAMRAATLLLGALSLLYGAIVVAFPRILLPIVAGTRFAVDRVAIGGWVLLALVLAVVAPCITVALANGGSALVFRLKLLGTVGATALGAAAAGIGQPSLVPATLAAGAAISGWAVWRSVRADFDILVPVVGAAS